LSDTVFQQRHREAVRKSVIYFLETPRYFVFPRIFYKNL